MDELTQYRKDLILSRQESQKSYDRHLISLAGGGLAISIAFIHNVIGDKTIQLSEYLLYAWILWTSCITLVLLSFYSSRLALDKAIRQLDSESIHKEHPGGFWNRVTSVLNILAGLAFVLGTISVIYFVIHNLRAPNA
jgi:hypothetical protein